MYWVIRLVSLSSDWFKLKDKYKQNKNPIRFLCRNSIPLQANRKLKMFVGISSMYYRCAFTFCCVLFLRFLLRKCQVCAYVCVWVHKEKVVLFDVVGRHGVPIRNLFDFLLVDANESYGREKENERTSWINCCKWEFFVDFSSKFWIEWQRFSYCGEIYHFFSRCFVDWANLFLSFEEKLYFNFDRPHSKCVPLFIFCLFL